MDCLFPQTPWILFPFFLFFFNSKKHSNPKKPLIITIMLIKKPMQKIAPMIMKILNIISSVSISFVRQAGLEPTPPRFE